MATPDFNANLNVEISRLAEFSFGLPGGAETQSHVVNEEAPEPARTKSARRTSAGEVILALVLLVAVAASLGWNRNVLVQQFPGLAAVLHMSAPANPAVKVDGANAHIKVWVDRNTALYYCPGSAAYGGTRNGQYLSQAEARLENFEPAMRKECTTASVPMLKRDPSPR